MRRCKFFFRFSWILLSLGWGVLGQVGLVTLFCSPPPTPLHCRHCFMDKPWVCILILMNITIFWLPIAQVLFSVTWFFEKCTLNIRLKQWRGGREAHCKMSLFWTWVVLLSPSFALDGSLGHIDILPLVSFICEWHWGFFLSSYVSESSVAVTESCSPLQTASIESLASHILCQPCLGGRSGE